MSDSGNGLRCPDCGARLGEAGCVLECHRNPGPTRRVEVKPGDAVEVVASDGRVRDLEAEVERLKAEVAALRADLEDAAGELMVSVLEHPPGSLVCKLVAANAIMRRQRDEARGDRLEAGAGFSPDGKAIAQLKAEVERLRDTNRRLNRRCQEAESKAAHAERSFYGATADLHAAAWQIRGDSARLREETALRKGMLPDQALCEIERLKSVVEGLECDLKIVECQAAQHEEEAVRLRADRQALLNWDVAGSDATGYSISGLWCGGNGTFPTREEAERRLLEYVREHYGDKGRSW